MFIHIVYPIFQSDPCKMITIIRILRFRKYNTFVCNVKQLHCKHKTEHKVIFLDREKPVYEFNVLIFWGKTSITILVYLQYGNQQSTRGIQTCSSLFIVYVMDSTTWWHTVTQRTHPHPDVLIPLFLLIKARSLTVWRLVNTHRITFTQTHTHACVRTHTES